MSATPTDEQPVDWNRATAVAAARQAIMWAGVPVQEAERYAFLAVDALIHFGLLLPTGTKTVEQFAARVLLDGEPVEAIPEPTTRERAEARVEAHDRERAQNPGWRGAAELVRRQQHTTPWESVDSSSVNSADAEDVQIAEQMLPAGVEVLPPYEEPVLPEAAYGSIDLLEAFGDARIQFWVCPIPGHSDRRGPDGRPVLTVDWRGDIAYCTFPDCRRSSQQSTEEKP